MDIWAACREGTWADIEAALASLAGGGKSTNRLIEAINSPSPYGTTLLSLAVWRNHLSLLLRLLEIGADPNLKDAESGWTALHRACYLGRFRAVSLLLSAGGSLAIEDAQGRTPCDLVSAHLLRHRTLLSPSSLYHASPWTRLGSADASISSDGQGYAQAWPGSGTSSAASWPHVGASPPGHGVFAVPSPAGAAMPQDQLGDVTLAGRQLSGLEATDVYSWGSGANYQLGTGVVSVQSLPCRVDVLHRCGVVAASCAKFHSTAITGTGELFTWGFGRGGRLGHPEFDIHGGQHAVIAPRAVAGPWMGHRVVAVAAAKHHTVAATDDGAVFTWGSNRDGRLGYTQVDTQPTPRRVATLRVRAVAVAAANKHSAALSWCGDLYTWGCNAAGQLGYGTTNGCSSAVPRLVDALKGRRLTMVSASKSHNVALSGEAEVFQWGFKSVTPTRVPLLRELSRSAGASSASSGGGGFSTGAGAGIKFHRALKPVIVAVAAGAFHSTALTNDGNAFVWRSADPGLACEPVTELSAKGHFCTAVSAGKYRTTVVTASGDLWAWEVPPSVTGSTAATGGNPDRAASKAGGMVATSGPPSAGKAAKKPSLALTLFRVHGLKGSVLVSVGEHHSLAITQTFRPPPPALSCTPVVHEEASKVPRYISGRPMLARAGDPTLREGEPTSASLSTREADGKSDAREEGRGGEGSTKNVGRELAGGSAQHSAHALGPVGVEPGADVSRNLSRGPKSASCREGGAARGKAGGMRGDPGGGTASGATALMPQRRHSHGDDHGLIFGEMDGDDDGGGNAGGRSATGGTEAASNRAAFCETEAASSETGGGAASTYSPRGGRGQSIRLGEEGLHADRAVAEWGSVADVTDGGVGDVEDVDDVGDVDEDEDEEDEEDEDEDGDGDISGSSYHHRYGSFGSLSNLSADMDLEQLALLRAGSSASVGDRRGDRRANDAGIPLGVPVPRVLSSRQGSRRSMSGAGAASSATASSAVAASPASSSSRSLSSSLSSSIGGSSWAAGSLPRASLAAGLVAAASSSGARSRPDDAAASCGAAGSGGVGIGGGVRGRRVVPLAARAAVPSLSSLCEAVLAKEVVEPRNVLSLVELTETLGTARQLRAFCLAYALLNLDALLATLSAPLSALRPAVLREMEELFDGCATQGRGAKACAGGGSVSPSCSRAGGASAFSYSDSITAFLNYGRASPCGPVDGSFFSDGRQPHPARIDVPAPPLGDFNFASAAASPARSDGRGLGVVPRGTAPGTAGRIVMPCPEEAFQLMPPSVPRSLVYWLIPGIQSATGPPAHLLCGPWSDDGSYTFAGLASSSSSSSSSRLGADASSHQDTGKQHASTMSSGRSLFVGRDEAAREVHRHKQLRALRKKLQQVAVLREMQQRGLRLDVQQAAKLASMGALEAALRELEEGGGRDAMSSAAVTAGGSAKGQAVGSGSGGAMMDKRKGVAMDEDEDEEDEDEDEVGSGVAAGKGLAGNGGKGKGKGGMDEDEEDEDGVVAAAGSSSRGAVAMVRSGSGFLRDGDCAGASSRGISGQWPGVLRALSSSPASGRAGSMRDVDVDAEAEADRVERMEREEQMLADAALAAALQEEEWAEAEVGAPTVVAASAAGSAKKKKKKNKKKKDKGEGKWEKEGGEAEEGAAGSTNGGHAAAGNTATVAASSRVKWGDIEDDHDDGDDAEEADDDGAHVSDFAARPGPAGTAAAFAGSSKGKGVAMVDVRASLNGPSSVTARAAADVASQPPAPQQALKQKTSQKKGSLSSFLAGTLTEPVPPPAAAATKAPPAMPAWGAIPPSAPRELQAASPSPSPAGATAAPMAANVMDASRFTVAASSLLKGQEGRPRKQGTDAATQALPLASSSAAAPPPGVAATVAAASTVSHRWPGSGSAASPPLQPGGAAAPPRAASARPAPPRVPLFAAAPTPSPGPSASTPDPSALPSGARTSTLTVLRFRTGTEANASITTTSSTAVAAPDAEDFWSSSETGFATTFVGFPFGGIGASSSGEASSARLPIKLQPGRGSSRSSGASISASSSGHLADAGAAAALSSSSPSGRPMVLPMAELLARRTGSQDGSAGGRSAGTAGGAPAVPVDVQAPRPRAWSVAAPAAPVGGQAAGGDAVPGGDGQVDGGAQSGKGEVTKQASFRDIQADQERKSRRWAPPTVTPTGNLALAFRATAPQAAGPGTSPVPVTTSKPGVAQSPAPSPSLTGKSPGGAGALLGFPPSRSPGLSSFLLPESRPVNNRWYRGVEEDVGVTSLRHIFEEEARDAAEAAARAAAEEDAARAAAKEAEEAERPRVRERAAEAECRRVPGSEGGRGKGGGKKEKRESGGNGKEKGGRDTRKVAREEGGVGAHPARPRKESGSRRKDAAGPLHAERPDADVSSATAAGPVAGTSTAEVVREDEQANAASGAAGSGAHRGGHGPGPAVNGSDGAGPDLDDVGPARRGRGRGRGRGRDGGHGRGGEHPGRGPQEGQDRTGQLEQDAGRRGRGRHRGDGHRGAGRGRAGPTVPAGPGGLADMPSSGAAQVESVKSSAED